MSNYEARKLYESVIEEVIADSRQDFEDSGIDESTLQELRKLWCEKLSQTKVCTFTWDEENELNNTLAHNIMPDPTLKASLLQLGLTLDLASMRTYSPTPNIHNPDLSAAGGAYSMGIELPSIKQEYEDSGLMLPKVNQSDGTVEFSMDLSQKEARAAIARFKQGLRTQTDGAGDLDDEDDDDIFNDSDDINSDLDDDLDSEKSEDEDAEQEGQIMLCLYDKVQRVKNKWKCNLKEGIANIDGRDYVFQRANGESEW